MLTRTLPENLLEIGFGQCRLIFTSGSEISLAPYDGSLIYIEGLINRIPSVGVSLSYASTLIEGGSLSNSSTYNVYLRNNAGSLELKASATNPTTDADGFLVRTGTPQWTFVGTVTTGTGVFSSVLTHFNIPSSYFLNRANHTGFQDASTINSGVFDLARIPVAAVSKLVVVADETARFTLTTAQVQNGDTVLQTAPDNAMYFVVDDSNLNNSSGYQLYTATADWSTISSKPQILIDMAAIASPSTNDFISYVGGAWIKQTLSQVKTTLSVNYTYQESAATSGTVTLNPQVTTLKLTGALAATLTIDCTSLLQGPGLTVYSTNGVTSLTITGGTNLGSVVGIAAAGIIHVHRHNNELIVE